MPKLSDIIEKLPKGWHRPQLSNKQKAKQRKPKKSNYQCVMEQIERIGTNGLFSILKGGFSSDRVHRWDSSGSANVIERKKKRKSCISEKLKYIWFFVRFALSLQQRNLKRKAYV